MPEVLLGVLGLLVEVGGDVPSPVIEGRDQRARRRSPCEPCWLKIDGENQCHEKEVTWCAWNRANPANKTRRKTSMVDMMIWTFTVTVTPSATAATIARRTPRRGSSPVRSCRYSEVEKMSMTHEPAGNVAMTMNIRAETMSAQPGEVPEDRVDRATHPRVRGARVGVIATQVAERQHDAEHEDAAVQQRRGTAVGTAKNSDPSFPRSSRPGAEPAMPMMTESKRPSTP